MRLTAKAKLAAYAAVAIVAACSCLAREQVLRDSVGKRVGTIEVRADGVQIARDGRGTRLGEYDPKSNTTRDARGMRVGEGNFLSALMTCGH